MNYESAFQKFSKSAKIIKPKFLTNIANNNICYRCDIALRNISSSYEKHKEVRSEKVNTLDSSIKVETCKNSCELTNSSKELVYVLPRSTINIT